MMETLTMNGNSSSGKATGRIWLRDTIHFQDQTSLAQGHVRAAPVCPRISS
jgi:hypothetical protein